MLGKYLYKNKTIRPSAIFNSIEFVCICISNALKCAPDIVCNTIMMQLMFYFHFSLNTNKKKTFPLYSDICITVWSMAVTCGEEEFDF